jgi:hypothetical protein
MLVIILFVGAESYLGLGSDSPLSTLFIVI